MSLGKIVWVDDEIDSLRSQKMFLEQKGYEVETYTNGFDALENIKGASPDIVLLDESMPGMSGLETLSQIKEIHHSLPVVMITKNETENLMDEAIGSQIADYLIKPVNPNQVLLSLKKILDNKRLVSEKTTSAYQQQFGQLFMELSGNLDYNEWMDFYRKLEYWELEMEKSNSTEMMDVFQSQKKEANTEFAKYIMRNYADWLYAKDGDAPVMSHTLMQSKVFPLLKKKEAPVFFILIDNLRYDQWKTIQPMLMEQFRMVQEETFYATLPTCTQYSRNAIFAGMLPIDIQKKFPDKWKNDDDEGGKNLFEEFFLQSQLKRVGLSDVKMSYNKILNHTEGQSLVNNMNNLMLNDLNVIVYNFVDMLSHARTEMEVLKELAADEIGYRSITKSWFANSALRQALAKLEGKDVKIVIATDHGSMRVQTPYKVIGDKQTTANLRYKHGRNLNYNPKEVFAFRNPAEAGLPSPNINSSFVFAKEDGFLCYPNNYNYYVNYYKDTFQHGGLSLEEMIVPLVVMESK
ncbi:MAG: two-component system response regulator [Pseudopedobacter saltans]|uniref:Two-component system response regulator n=1 Tax=Pseudopedobacter saltans TaxID=151895 RepID=A0A2W5F8I7_9SPHI|nr:MAG: two-component system response regulator [Pseudopedobacter saltans]